MLSAGRIPQCPTSSCSGRSLMPCKSSSGAQLLCLAAHSPWAHQRWLCTISPVQNICWDVYIWHCLCVKPSPQPGPCKELCRETLVRDQTGKMSGETGGTTSTGGKSWQHSLQRVADATMLTQSLPKSLFVWVPSVGFFRVRGCSCTQSQWQTHTGSNPATLCSFCQLEKEGWSVSCFPCFLPPQKSLGYQTTTCVEKIEQVKMEKKVPETISSALPRRSCYFTLMPAEAVDVSLSLSSDFRSLINQLHM